jgi:hypothetical protein
MKINIPGFTQIIITIAFYILLYSASNYYNINSVKVKLNNMRTLTEVESPDKIVVKVKEPERIIQILKTEKQNIKSYAIEKKADGYKLTIEE